ncbi:MAG: radical SAM protein [Chloroflexota bacterium]|nr:radical SAM protein [Chloroflexota bacterium]
MANIIITNVCNANCSFCFARENTQASQKFISLDDLNKRIDFIRSSGLSQIRLIGGEPTLHPNFQEIVNHITSTELDLILFSNGFIPQKNLGCLIEIPQEKFAVLLNVNAKSNVVNLENLRQKVLRSLNIKVTLGFTILNPFFDLSPYFQWINDFGLQRKVRLGLAQPIYGGGNQYLSPKRYRSAAQSILDNAEKAKNENIQLEFDCGFVRCMFTDEEWQQLEDWGVIAESHCAPNLDIGLDGQVFHCFSISQIATSLDKANTTEDAIAELNDQRKIFREFGIYPHCSDCTELINGRCCGGCLSLTLHRFHNLNPEVLKKMRC